MDAQTMWKRFSEQNNCTEQEYEAWAFGGEPDKLANLVLSGEKTATSSAYKLYESEGEPIPKAGEYSVILDGKNRAVCVIRTTKVFVLDFCEVPASHAYNEGVGDKSLAYWREVHRSFFKQELETAGLCFEEHTPVVCEEFEVVYR